MRKRLLLILPALQQRQDYEFRLVKYSRFPPLSLLTLAGLTPEDDWEIMVRDEHIESSEVGVDVDLVGIQTYISCANRSYELAKLWRSRGAKVVLGGLHPTSMPDEAAPHADAIVLGPAEAVWPTCWTISIAASSRKSTTVSRRGLRRWPPCPAAT